MVGPPPLTGIKVLEFAGLAPGPFAGLLLADAGASVLRVDRPKGKNASSSSSSSSSPSASTDQLTRHKASIAVDLKDPAGRALALRLAREADVLIDPFRPGVMERLGLGPDVFLSSPPGTPPPPPPPPPPLPREQQQGQGHGERAAANPRLVYARVTGFRRDGRYRDMAGHDINYLAVSGVLDMLGRAGERPHPPANILGDFAGGGAVLFQGILMALLVVAARGGSGGGGQVVEANMVDGASYLATFPRLARKRGPDAAGGAGGWGPRGTNLLDGGCPYYDTYETQDGGYMAVGALEPQFFSALVRGLGLEGRGWEARRHDRSCWAEMRGAFAAAFRGRARREWEAVFDGTDACCTPVLGYGELEATRRGSGAGEGGDRDRDRDREGDQRPVVTLRETPCLAVDTGAAAAAPVDGPSRGQGPGVPGDGYAGEVLVPGEKGEERLKEWLGWEKGRDFDVAEGGGLVLKTVPTSKL
ncbi:hypothetical protein VSDG_07310 [Cytospora chrysosperma]|uniref:Isopenicillin N epimerase component 2 n=1 Tax=Cytospora chrysosperma TaxID=252740 RepID=A0A423VPZ3_CYTCH|nr:hypothetical protein VSDG_07310 [Valsa sordida]